jgi:hypothetical protein
MYKEIIAGGFQQLLELFPDDEFQNLTRSTIPLLHYWRQHEQTAHRVITGVFGADLPIADLRFEYEVPAFGGNPPSCTDIMCLSNDVAVAVEAKSTEPMYELVGGWRQDGNQQNRLNVLNHWIDLIDARTHGVNVRNVDGVVYQMLHRLASACSMGRNHCAVLYQLFPLASNAAEYIAEYVANLGLLAEATGAGDDVRIILHNIPITPGAAHAAVAAAIGPLDRINRAHAVREAIIADDLFEFGHEDFVEIPGH